MNSFKFLSILAFLVVAIDFGKSSPVSIEASTPEEANNLLTLQAPHLCLESPIGLPDCNFDNLPESSRRDVEDSSDLPDTTEHYEDSSDLPETSEYLKESALIGGPNHKPTTIVYKIEGCLPPALPFKVPICKPEDLDTATRNVEVFSLLPFKDTSVSQVSSEPPLVFPELDVEKWKAEMASGVWTQPSGNAQAGEAGQDGKESTTANPAIE